MANPGPSVIHLRLLSCNVCVPKDWTNEQINEFANAENPTGIGSGWTVPEEQWWDARQAEQGTNDALRCQCSDDENYIHVPLIC